MSRLRFRRTYSFLSSTVHACRWSRITQSGRERERAVAECARGVSSGMWVGWHAACSAAPALNHDLGWVGSCLNMIRDS